MNKVLIVTYYWPPGSGAGVQRWLKFAKYLPASGWEPVILTVEPDYATYPATDSTLEDEISPGLRVYRTKATDWFRIYGKAKSGIPSAGFAANDNNSLTGKIIRFIRGNFFIPDPRKGWNRYAIKKASRLIVKEQISHIITTSPPHSTQLIGLAIKKKFPGIIWVADLRDPWTDIYYYDSFYHTPLARLIDAGYERKVLKSADRLITVGGSLKKSFITKVAAIETKIAVITNGYDAEDFLTPEPAKPFIFTISYIGTLSDSYPVEGFIEAVSALAENGYEIRLRFVGSISSRQKELIMAKSDILMTEFIPYVNHSDAIRYMRESSILLLIIPDHRSSRSILTGKLFEYLASCKPVLCLGPEDGDAAEILKSTGHGKCSVYNDSDSIRSKIEEFINSGAGSYPELPAEYSRENLTGKLVSILEERG